MARIVSKTNWNAGDAPVGTDFNRIENNNEQAFSEIDQLEIDIDASIAQLESDIDSDINTLKNSAITFTGVKTFTDGIKLNEINPISSTTGVTIDGVVIKSGAVIGTVWSS